MFLLLGVFQNFFQRLLPLWCQMWVNFLLTSVYSVWFLPRVSADVRLPMSAPALLWVVGDVGTVHGEGGLNIPPSLS